MRARWFVVLLVAAVAGLAVSASATATTAPAVQVTIRVTVTDHGIKLSQYTARRGWAAHFVVRNAGSKTYAVDIGGLLTGPISPGKRKTVSASLEERGTYPIKVLLQPVPKKYTGVFRVV